MFDPTMVRLSLITATYNASKYLPCCFANVAAQKLPIEHIVIDGDSTDGTKSVIQQHSQQISKYISEPDRGLYDALNKGISMASGEIIGILNADDYYSNNSVLRQVLEVFDNPDIDACYGDLLYINADSTSGHAEATTKSTLNTLTKIEIKRFWRSGFYSPKSFYWGWMPPHPTFFVRRSIYEKFGAFRLDMGTAADYELMLRLLLKHRINCHYIPKILVYMRTGGLSNVTVVNRFHANRMDRKAWSANNLKPYPWTIAFKVLRKVPQYLLRPTRSLLFK